MHKVDCSIIPTTISYNNFNSFFKAGLVITGLALCILGILAVCVGDAFGAINASWYYFELAGLVCFAAFCIDCCCCKKRSEPSHSQNQVRDSTLPQQKTSRKATSSNTSDLLGEIIRTEKMTTELLDGITPRMKRLEEERLQKYQKVAEEDHALKSLLEAALEALNQNNVDEGMRLLEEVNDASIIKIISGFKLDNVSSPESKMSVLKRMVELRLNLVSNKLENQKTLLG